MISPEEFYSESERPSRSVSKNLWGKIEHSLPAVKAPLFAVHDRRSFIYGMAASFVLYLAGVGAFNLIKQNMEASQSSEIRLDKAYQSAIKEFEAVVPSLVTRIGDSGDRQGVLKSREQQIKLVNEAIGGLRADIAQQGPSPIKSERLRELYSLKLQILQTMIENGEVEL